MAPPISETDLLIVGAGPAGLMAACWASQYSISTRIIDDKPDRVPTGHADGIQSRTLEIFQSFGVLDKVLRQGVFDTEMCYWDSDQNGGVKRANRMISQPEGLSRFKQMLWNQGLIEQTLTDYVNGKRKVTVERGKRAEILEFDRDADHEAGFPVVVKVRRLENEQKEASEAEMIRARYMIACDGSHSWAREQLEIPMEGSSTDSLWGVLDIIPITDFPDIRQSCAIHSKEHGSVMTAPRENRLVRLYIQLDDHEAAQQRSNRHSEDTPKFLLKIAQKILKPYSITCHYCDWWSLYRIGQRLVPQYSAYNRIFLAGDAAHTHSPTAGQGLNVSTQDTYNLTWKIGSVITGIADPAILETYQFERRPVAQELLKMDAAFVQAYEHQSSKADPETHKKNEKEEGQEGVEAVRERYSGFRSGVTVTYLPSLLVSYNQCTAALARSIKLGMRLPSFPIVSQAEAHTVELAERLSSVGHWRLLVFSGDLRCEENMRRLRTFSEGINALTRTRNGGSNVPFRAVMRDLIEVLLIHSAPRTEVDLLALPEIFHPFDQESGWDYWKVFADGAGKAYKGYGIDEKIGCLVLCRPDQHVAWMGALDDLEDLEKYFSAFLRRGDA